MSPEQLSGDPCDGRSDLYSLALVFYRMITGRLPFEAETAQETMIKRLTDEPLPLAVARPDLRFPALLQTVLDRSLTRSPADRYATAVEFGRDLATATAPMTGVDLEAGTQVVKPEEMDRLLATVPATRVDPDIAADFAGGRRRWWRTRRRGGRAGQAGGAGGREGGKEDSGPVAGRRRAPDRGGRRSLRDARHAVRRNADSEGTIRSPR